MNSIYEIRVGDYLYSKTRDKYCCVKSIKSLENKVVGENYSLLVLFGSNNTFLEDDLELFDEIPLTEEVLILLGFIPKYDRVLKTFEYIKSVCIVGGVPGRCSNLDYFHITLREGMTNSGRKWYCHVDNPDFCSLGSGEVDSVHQLQNLILDVTCIEKFGLSDCPGFFIEERFLNKNLTASTTIKKFENIIRKDYDSLDKLRQLTRMIILIINSEIGGVLYSPVLNQYLPCVAGTDFLKDIDNENKSDDVIFKTYLRVIPAVLYCLQELSTVNVTNLLLQKDENTN